MQCISLNREVCWKVTNVATTKNLFEYGYIEIHRCCFRYRHCERYTLAHPTSTYLLHAFRRVLIMDCTYKNNKYMLPLMGIVGVTSTEMTFSIAFAYLEAEREDNFSWCLDKLRLLMHGWQILSVIVIDWQA